VNDTLTIRNGRNVLRIERRFAHAPEKVWRAVIEPERLSEWYPANVTELEPLVGGKMALDYGQGWTTTAVVTAIDPPRLFAFTERALSVMPREGDGEIRIELRPDGDGCLMVFSQTFDDRATAAGYAAGWQACLDVLEAALSGEPARHADVSVERHEFYFKAFGLDRADVERTSDGWRIRYERHVSRQSIDKIWTELTGSTAVDVGEEPPAAFVAGGVHAGAITAVEPPALLEYEWLDGDQPAGRVRWELTSDPGGARIELTQTGPDRVQPDPDAWRTHIEALVARLIETPV
jgi:uncharacterized protein YndB with AHSA1/START domain